MLTRRLPGGVDEAPRGTNATVIMSMSYLRSTTPLLSRHPPIFALCPNTMLAMHIYGAPCNHAYVLLSCEMSTHQTDHCVYLCSKVPPVARPRSLAGRRAAAAPSSLRAAADLYSHASGARSPPLCICMEPRCGRARAVRRAAGVNLGPSAHASSESHPRPQAPRQALENLRRPTFWAGASSDHSI